MQSEMGQQMASEFDDAALLQIRRQCARRAEWLMAASAGDDTEEASKRTFDDGLAFDAVAKAIGAAFFGGKAEATYYARDYVLSDLGHRVGPR